MNKLIFFLLSVILIFFSMMLFLFLKPAKVSMVNVPGFEAADAEIKKKYANKKTFSKEELDEMDSEIRALTEEKIKKYKFSKSYEKNSSISGE